jgi:thiol:disulfide interchange protein/DsbC/DsbD-like thiol-disulfide interchange protein
MHMFQRGLIVGLLNVFFVLAFVPASQAWVESESVEQPQVSVSLVSERPYLVAGQNARFALKIIPDEGWHIYWKNPGDTGIASQLSWQLPADFRVGDLEWPVPERIDYQGATNFGYHGETWLLSQLAIPPSAKNNDSSPTEITLKAQAQWLLCKEICIPGTADLQLRLPVYHQPPVNNGQADKSFEQRAKLLPSLIYSAQASYRMSDFLEISVPLEDLPIIDRPPQVFLGQADVIDNSDTPTVSVVDDFLLIRAKVDPYLKDSPSLLPVLLSLPSSDKSDATSAVEFVVREGELPAVVMASLAAKSGLLNNAGQLPDNESINIVYALVFALLGGIILNAMPCVFPVLSLKILSLVESGQQSAIIRQQHGLAYAAGVIISFVFIAAVLLAVRFFGEQIGWGFQLQSPWFVAFLVYLLFVLGLSLSGFIELGSSLQNVGSSIAGHNEQHWRSSFFTGVLATVVATPCTAPFMGSAMGFALSQPTLIALLVFAVMGLGLALPFLLIAFIPRLAAVLPQPGQWMVTFKELLAFPIYLTVVWLLWVFSRQTNVDAVALLLVGLVMLTVTLWLLRLRQLSSAGQTSTRFLEGLLLLLSAGLAIGVAIVAGGLDRGYVSDPQNKLASDQQQSIDDSMGEVYDAQQLATALANGEAVFVNMTADWCITCKLNERIALSTDTVKKLFKTESVRYMKGDWTNSDAAITAYLAEFNRNGVPLYVYYAPDTPPVVLPQILTAGIIRNYIMPE